MKGFQALKCAVPAAAEVNQVRRNQKSAPQIGKPRYAVRIEKLQHDGNAKRTQTQEKQGFQIRGGLPGRPRYGPYCQAKKAQLGQVPKAQSLVVFLPQDQQNWRSQTMQQTKAGSNDAAPVAAVLVGDKFVQFLHTFASQIPATLLQKNKNFGNWFAKKAGKIRSKGFRTGRGCGCAGSRS